MLPFDGPIPEAILLRFLHIKRYNLPHTWKIDDRTLDNGVIWLVENGALTLEADGEAVRCEADALLFLAPGTRIRCRAASAVLRLISLNFEAGPGPGARLPAALRLPLRFAGDAGEPAAVLRGMIADAAAPASAGKPLLLQAGLLRVLGLMAAAGGEAGHGLAAADARVREAIALMASRPDALPTVRQLAEAVRTSEPHLRKLFLRDVGMPPLQALHRLKAEAAKRRLAGTDERVAEIAYALGYADANYFARMFKKAVGEPPQEYRRKHRDWMLGQAE